MNANKYLPTLAALLLSAAISCAAQDRARLMVTNYVLPNFEKPVFKLLELESRSWKLPSGNAEHFIERRVVHFTGRPDVVVMLYGSGSVTNCVDCYVALDSTSFILIGHDDAEAPLLAVRGEMQKGESYISMARRGADETTRIMYQYVFNTDYSLVRTLHTFVVPR